MNMTSSPSLYISPFFVSAGNITSYRFKFLMMLWTQLLITLVNSYHYTLIWKILFTSKLSAYPLNVESVTLMFSSSLIIGFFIQRIRIMTHNVSPPWHLVQRPVYLLPSSPHFPLFLSCSVCGREMVMVNNNDGIFQYFSTLYSSQSALNYVNMQNSYIDILDNYVNMRNNYVNMLNYIVR